MPVLTAETAMQVTMDHDNLQKNGTLLGTGGGRSSWTNTVCLVRAALVIARFFRHESCGQCTQCREGTGWLHKLFSRHRARHRAAARPRHHRGRDASTWRRTPSARSSDAAAWGAGCFVRRFRQEFEAHIEHKGCPLAGVSFEV